SELSACGRPLYWICRRIFRPTARCIGPPAQFKISAGPRNFGLRPERRSGMIGWPAETIGSDGTCLLARDTARVGEKSPMRDRGRELRDSSLLVWLFALGYFLSYIPYSAL